MKRLIPLVAIALVLLATTAGAKLKPGIRPFVKVSMIAMSVNADEVQDVDAGFGFGIGAGRGWCRWTSATASAWAKRAR